MAGGDDYIRAMGNAPVVNVFLKFAVAILGIVAIIEAGALIVLSEKVGNAKPLPIFVDTVTGLAKAVKYDTVDASGEKRSEIEIQEFVRTYISNLYTFNKYTVKSNFECALSPCAVEAVGAIKNFWQSWVQQEYIERNYQGLANLSSCITISDKPDLKLQIRFDKRVLNGNGEIEKSSDNIAILRIKPIVRTEANPHGLLILEYREADLKADGKE